MNRTEKIHLAKRGIYGLTIAARIKAVRHLKNMSLSVAEVYCGRLDGCDEKPLLFNHYLKRTWAWMLRTMYWQSKYDKLNLRATDFLEELNQLRSLYNL